MAPADDEGVPDPSAQTTAHIRRAREGDRNSLAWIVRRFSPLLLAQARFRMGESLLRHYEPGDIVSEVWAVAIRRLSAIETNREHQTPTLLRFLGTTLVFEVNNLARKHLRTRSAGLEGDGTGSATGQSLLSQLSAETSGVLTSAVREERKGVLLACIDALEPPDREVVILRGVEQHDNQRTAELLGMKPNTVSHRYQRAIEKLREKLPGSVFDELDAG